MQLAVMFPFQALVDKLEDKLYEVDRLSQKNKKHVDELRDLNNRLMQEIEHQIRQELEAFRLELTKFGDRAEVEMLREALR